MSELHVTWLHQLGVDHDELTYQQAGRTETLTASPGTGAQVTHAILTRRKVCIFYHWPAQKKRTTAGVVRD